jgi:hypothetical protein
MILADTPQKGETMLERLGPRQYAAPFLAVLAIFCVFGLAMYPNLHAAPKDVPFAIVSLDEGAETPAGALNLGDQTAAALISGIAPAADGAPAPAADAAAPIAWTRLDSQAALDQAMEDNQYYGAVVLPADFSAAQAAAQAGTGQGASVQAIVNQGKNPMLASIMQQALTAQFTAQGLKVEATTVHAAVIGGGSMGAMMSVMVMVMPPFMMTMIGSVLLFLVFRPQRGAGRGTRGRAYGKQLALAVPVAALVGLAAMLMATWVGGLDVPAGAIFLFMWIAAFCLMAAFLGALDLAVPLGALVILACFACGMSAAMFAPEMLPGLWRDWFYPWVPQHFLGDGLRSIIYLGGGGVNAATGPLALFGATGLILMAAAAFVPRRAAKV